MIKAESFTLKQGHLNHDTQEHGENMTNVQ